MTSEQRKNLKERIDRLGCEWFDCPPEDEAVRQSLCGEIFRLVFDLYLPGDPSKPTETGAALSKRTYSPADSIAEVFLQDFHKYDKAKGRLSDFLQKRIRDRCVDNWRRDNGLRRLSMKGRDSDGEEKKTVWVDPFVHAAEENDPLEAVSTGIQDRPETGAELDATAWKLIAAMLEMPLRLTGQANNPVRHNYFRLFFTDGIAAAIHTADVVDAFTHHERELFQAMKEQFLDFFLERQCRSAADIRASALKPYGSLVDGRPMEEEPPQPLPLDVFTSYLAREEGYQAKSAAVSQQRTAYYEFMRSSLL